MAHFLYNTMAYDTCHVIAHTALNKSYRDSPCPIQYTHIHDIVTRKSCCVIVMVSLCVFHI